MMHTTDTWLPEGSVDSRREKLRGAVLLLVVFSAFFAVGIYLQSNRTIGDPDGFYHAKMAQVLSSGVILHELPWMRFSTLATNFTDHHLLYHALLVPFVNLGNPLLGVKLATAFFMAGFFTVLYWFMRRLHMRMPIVFTLLLLCTSSFTFRLGLVKANSASLIVLLFILFAIFERRYFLLTALDALYVWLYGGWFVSWLVLAVYVVTAFVHRRVSGRTDHWYRRVFSRHRSKGSGVQLFVFAAAGSAFGLVINPYWPSNIEFYLQQVWQIAIVNMGTIVNVGGEWSAVSSGEMFEFFSLLTVPFAVAVVLAIVHPEKIQLRSWVFLALSIITVVFTLKSRRYIELSAPFIILFSAAAWSDVFPRHLLRIVWNTHPTWVVRHLVFAGCVAAVVFTFLPDIGFGSRLVKVKRELAGGITFTRYEKAAQWLAAHTPRRSTIVHSDWDDWPMLFYHNDRNYYIIGLDPTFMYNYDPALYESWSEFTGQGKVHDAVGEMRNVYHSEYLMIEKNHTDMQRVISENVYFRLMYEDDESWVYKLVTI